MKTFKVTEDFQNSLIKLLKNEPNDFFKVHWKDASVLHDLLEKVNIPDDPFANFLCHNASHLIVESASSHLSNCPDKLKCGKFMKDMKMAKLWQNWENFYLIYEPILDNILYWAFKQGIVDISVERGGKVYGNFERARLCQEQAAEQDSAKCPGGFFCRVLKQSKTKVAPKLPLFNAFGFNQPRKSSSTRVRPPRPPPVRRPVILRNFQERMEEHEWRTVEDLRRIRDSKTTFEENAMRLVSNRIEATLAENSESTEKAVILGSSVDHQEVEIQESGKPEDEVKSIEEQTRRTGNSDEAVQVGLTESSIDSESDEEVELNGLESLEISTEHTLEEAALTQHVTLEPVELKPDSEPWIFSDSDSEDDDAEFLQKLAAQKEKHQAELRLLRHKRYMLEEEMKIHMHGAASRRSRIQLILADNPVFLFSRTLEKEKSEAIMKILSKKYVPATQIFVDDNVEVRLGIKEYTGNEEFPQVVINGNYVEVEDLEAFLDNY